MANDSDVLDVDGVRLTAVTVELLDQLSAATNKCEQLIDEIGTERDDANFRDSLAAQVRDAVALCHCIKQKFNEMAGIQCDPPESVQLQHLQQQFIATHSRLKQCVSTIKTKCKQSDPHSHRRVQQSPDNGHAAVKNKNSMCAEKEMEMDLDLDGDNSLVKEIVMEGWLYKKSRYLKSWRKRWCVLDKNTEDLTLFTFKHEKQYTQPTETLVITDDVEMRASLSTLAEFILTERASNHSDAHFRFKAENECQRSTWLDTLRVKQEENNQCKFAQQPPQSQSPSHSHSQLHTALSDISDVSADALSTPVPYDSSPVCAGVGDHAANCQQQQQQLVVSNEHEYVSFNLYDECDTEDMDHEQQLTEEEDTQQSNYKKYDASTPDVRDCLELMDDLQLVRTEMSSKDLHTLAQFEHSLQCNHFVTKEEINKLRDVSIKVIGSMLDHDS